MYMYLITVYPVHSEDDDMDLGNKPSETKSKDDKGMESGEMLYCRS